MIIRGSRYERSTLVRVQRADGSSAMAVYVDRQLFIAPMDYANHVMSEGERLDTLAATAYDSSQLWWLIARANPEAFYPGTVPPGTSLRIPSARSIR
jgi:hypothetical protein